jgi:small subunit ribosomal protein S4
MGDPKKQRKKFARPSHPWQKERIEIEKEFTNTYGFKNKKEIWKTGSLLRSLQQQAKNLIASSTKQSEIESRQLILRLTKLGLLAANSKVEDVLNIKSTDIMDRRLQTLVHKKKLSKSVNQARQFIVHRHVSIADQMITSPSFLVSIEDEPKIKFIDKSSLASEMHPERVQEEKMPKKAKKKVPETRPKRIPVKKFEAKK